MEVTAEEFNEFRERVVKVESKCEDLERRLVDGTLALKEQIEKLEQKIDQLYNLIFKGFATVASFTLLGMIVYVFQGHMKF